MSTKFNTYSFIFPNIITILQLSTSVPHSYIITYLYYLPLHTISHYLHLMSLKRFRLQAFHFLFVVESLGL